jgi:hypothetical protein
MLRARLLRALVLVVGVCVLATTATVPSEATAPSSGLTRGAKASDHQTSKHRIAKHGKRKHKVRKHKVRKHRRHQVVTKPAPVPATPSPAPAATPPTNAAKIFRWGNAQLHDEFIGPLASTWAVNPAGAGLVRNQNGMITLNTTETSGTVTADWNAGARQYGRWEARVRTRQYGTSATPYRAVWELVPTTGDQCARSIVLSESTIGQNTARLHVNNGGLDFSAAASLDLRRDTFHTYAVEVTPDHISWFIDTRVVMTERRSAARTGAAYTVRFKMAAPTGVRMNKSRMQMDWVRYYTLERKNAQSIQAPPAAQGSFTGAC